MIGDEVVVAQRQVRRQLAGKADRPAVFQEQFAGVGPGNRHPFADDPHRFPSSAAAPAAGSSKASRMAWGVSAAKSCQR